MFTTQEYYKLCLDMVKEFIQLYHGNIKVVKYRDNTTIEVRKDKLAYIYIEINTKFRVELKLMRSKIEYIKNLSTFSNSIPIIQQKLFGLTEYFLCISCDVNGPVKITHDFHRDTNTPYPYTRIEIHNKKLFSQVCRLITDNDKFSEIINNNIVLIGAEVVEKVLTNRPNKRWNFIYFSNKNINLPVYVIAIVIE